MNADVAQSSAASTQQGHRAYGDRPSHDNRRSETRFPMTVRVRYPRRNAFFHEYTRNISRGGMFVCTAEPRDIGERFYFELEVPGEEKIFRLLGEVRWRMTPQEVAAYQEPGEQPEAGMGIAFLFNNTEQQRDFNERVNYMLQDAFGPEIAQALLRH